MKESFCIFIIFLSLADSLYSQSYFGGEKIRQELIKEIRMRVGDDAEIIVSQSIQDISFPLSNVFYTFVFASSDSRYLNGNFMAGIEFRNGSELLRRIEVPARVKIYRNLLVAKRTISQGEIISNENTNIEKKELPQNVTYEECIPDNLLGKTASHSIVRGSVITKKLVSEPFAIRRGDKVRIVVLSGMISITTNGTALQDARPGESLRCVRDGTRLVLSGIAAKDGTVIITN
ncbi:MAG: flagellar basal body P-ring formation chaperone FlgA [Candidatus Kapaibacteriales bacterium]